MGRIGIDVTAAGLIPDGDYISTVAKVEHQIKIGDKWNKDGTKTVPFEEWEKVADDRKRLHYSINIAGKGVIFHDLYLMESAAGFVKQFLVATGTKFDKTGFDTEEPVGKQLNIRIAIQEEGGYEAKSIISKMWKV